MQTPISLALFFALPAVQAAAISTTTAASVAVLPEETPDILPLPIEPIVGPVEPIELPGPIVPILPIPKASSSYSNYSSVPTSAASESVEASSTPTEASATPMSPPWSFNVTVAWSNSTATAFTSALFLNSTTTSASSVEITETAEPSILISDILPVTETEVASTTEIDILPFETSIASSTTLEAIPSPFLG
ncbi:hypothetical protein GQ53DRAFT_847087 [Thozetella sp. PMI_491]|nr:hypothetical protein GQ53DRAFT_847087 [Thozetella sp. PMI_491]